MDARTPEDAKRILEHTGADGVMIGRAALGNPWMIYRTVKFLETGELLPEPEPREKMQTAMLHLNRLVELKGENIAVREFRQHAAYYLKGARGSTGAKVAANQATKQSEMEAILNEFVLQYEEKALAKQD